jgi:hypothetical protein
MTGAVLPVATNHAARLRHHAGIPALGLVGAHRTRGARTGLACDAARGNPAPARGPAGCLLDGLPPRRLHGQGSLRAHECSLGLRPPLDRSGVDAARRHRSPGAGEDLSPTSRQHQEEDAMRQFEQGWLELGSRVARSLHYQHPRSLRLLEAHRAEEVRP